ncbi:MAG: hypothetical protein IJR68_07020, partial [Fretibacterium sp.]|nr:hypothetical protein [Fretibacterium sp.]
MKKVKTGFWVLLSFLLMASTGCGGGNAGTNAKGVEQVTEATKIANVINDPLFGDYGRLIFPVNSGYYSGDTI